MNQTQDLLLENKQLRQAFENSQSEILVLKQNSQSEIAFLKYQLEQLRRVVFGAKSERFVSSGSPDQLSLPIEIETTDEPTLEEVITIEAHERKKTKKKSHPLRQSFPDSLPREVILIFPEGYDVNTTEKPIGEEVTEVLEEIPGKFYVKQYRRLKFASKQSGGVVIGNLPTRPIEKGLFGENLLAQLLIDKYCDHIPFYRQEQRFKRAGIKLAYSTLADTPRQLSKLFEPLYEVLKSQSLQSNYLQIDETPHPVQDKDVKGKTHRGYLWVYRSVEQRMVLFDYRPGRASKWPREILKNYNGFIQTDGYSGYDEFEKHSGITMVGCMAHARRYFEKALDNDKSVAEYFLNELQKVYEVEREIKEENKTKQEILSLRKEQSRPILYTLEKWLKEKIITTTPATPIGKAISYSLSRWKKLTVYLDHAFLEIDNNLVENAIRPTVLGRKNYLFSGSHEGAQRSAMIYSLLGTCKMNNVNPKEWLADVLLRLPDTKTSELIGLLPSNWKKS